MIEIIYIPECDFDRFLADGRVMRRWDARAEEGARIPSPFHAMRFLSEGGRRVLKMYVWRREALDWKVSSVAETLHPISSSLMDPATGSDVIMNATFVCVVP